jgi:rhodanese-related sulfurtransferase
MATLSEIEPRDLKALLDRGTAVVIDVREPDEHAREHIAGSRLEPLSRFDVGQIPSGGQTVVLHCKGGSRSAEAGARLIAAGRSVTHLKGGLQAWKAAGMPTEVNLNAPIPIMRQVQIIVGSLVLATSILAYAIHPAFLLLTGFFGAGLLFAGTTGICGMAAVLRRMPWNKALRCEGCSHT